jgi:transketolase
MALVSGMPTYIRIGKKGEVDLCEDRAVPVIGDGFVLQTGKQLCIFAVGTVAQEAQVAGGILKERGIEAEVVLTHTVKPCPTALFDSLLSRFDCFVTVEEHARIGGFGESFLSHLALKSLQKRVICLGTSDSFMPIVGSQAFARSYFGIEAASIVASAQALVQN